MNESKMELLGVGLDYLGRSKRQRKVRDIHIDTHEDLDRITDVILAGMGYTVTRRLLPLGDYQWDSPLGLVIIERKTPADARDIRRLSEQVRRLREARVDGGIFPILLIDHRREGSEWAPWEDEDFDNLLVSISGRIRIAHCLQGQLAHRIDALYKWSQKTSHGLFDASV